MRTKRVVLSGVFLALGLLMPFITGQIPEVGNMLLPMHIPVLICGYVCGWQYGLAVGIIVPLLRSLFFGMPPLFPKAICMAFELAVYGMVVGLLYQRLRHRKGRIYISLLAAMVAGRAVWGIVAAVVYPLAGVSFGPELFLTEAFINALAGIVVQLLMIPALVYSLEKAGFLEK